MTIKKIVSLLILLLPIFIYYDYPLTTINISNSLSLIILLLVFFSNFSKFKIKNIKFLMFICYIVFSTVVLSFLGASYPITSFIYILLNLGIVFLIANSQGRCINCESFIKYYKVICFISIVFFVIQHIVRFIGNTYIFGTFPFLPITNAYKGINSGIVSGSSNELLSARSLSSFFSEPSHFSVYLLPLVVILIAEKKYLHLVVAILCIIFSISGNGIIALVILIFCKLSVFNPKKKNRLRNFIILLVFGLCIYFILSRITVFSTLFSDLFSGGLNRGAKADYRINRGFYIFSLLPPINKIFGIGFMQITSFLTNNGYTTPYDFNTSNLEYSNFIAQLLIYFGVVGFLIFLWFIFWVFWKGNSNSRSLLLCVFALWFSTSMMFDAAWMFFVTFILVFSFGKINASQSLKKVENESLVFSRQI